MADGDLVFPVFAVLCLVGLYGFRPTACHQGLPGFFYVTLVSAFFCVVWQWPRLRVFTEQGFYPGDSLYTLGPVEAVALAILTLLLLLCACYVSWHITGAVLRRVQVGKAVAVIGGLLNGVAVLVMYWLFLSMVPQLYYTVYLQIFPDLPLQWVVRGLIPLDTFHATLIFREQPSLSVHAAGLLGWVLFVNSITQWLSRQWLLNSQSPDL